METIRVNTGKSYEVHIGPGLLDKIDELLPERLRGKGGKGSKAGKAVLITDTNVNLLYAEKVEKKLELIGYTVIKAVVPAGEEAKSGEQYLKLLSFMAENQVTRSDVIFALGGGVVGDLSGFAAATYLRGIDFIQLPTTLLSAVDSSVGGKTAINLPEGKNLAGAFYQPAAVIMDTETLDTLSEDVFADGCAEVIKYGVIWDEELFSRLENNNLTKERRNSKLLVEIISRCVEIKEKVVSRDENDRGLRNILNFGHTTGHSIEKNSQFKVSHGSAVAIGMVLAARAAERSGMCPVNTEARIKNLVEAYGLPSETDFGKEELMAGMMSDKKIEGQTINLIMPECIGTCTIKKMEVQEAKKLLFGE